MLQCNGLNVTVLMAACIVLQSHNGLNIKLCYIRICMYVRKYVCNFIYVGSNNGEASS